MGQSEKSTVQKLKSALVELELQIQLHVRQRFRWKDGPQQTAELLQCAINSEHQAIKTALEKVATLFSDKQCEKLKQHGVDLSSQLSLHNVDPAMTYRGAAITKPNITPELEPEPKGKRKIIYRGQVKWID